MTVGSLDLLEPGVTNDSEAAVQVKRRFIFSPCLLLEQYVEQIEQALAERRHSEVAATLCDGAPTASRQLVRLRCLEPGCGSGRNLAWLAARRRSIDLGDGTSVQVIWEVVGIDFWYGALVRMQELCHIVDYNPGQVKLYHCEIDPETGDMRHLKPPAETCKHHVVPRTHIKDPPASGVLEGGSFDLILCVRFLSRPLHKYMSMLLSGGGYVLYNTFLNMNGTKAFGRPNGREHLLEPAELSDIWFGSAQGFQIVCDDVEIEKPHGRELSLFLAMKK
eukprot:366228-Chlamydomonas_euryale.AAC.16